MKNKIDRNRRPGNSTARRAARASRLVALTTASAIAAWLCAVAAGKAAQAPATNAGRPPAVPAASSIDARSGDELDRALFAPDGATPSKSSPPAQSTVPPNASSTSSPEHPMASIASQMREVGRRLRGADGGPETQQAQQRIVAALERLTADASKSRGDRRSTGQAPKPSSNATASGPAAEPGRTTASPSPTARPTPSRDGAQPSGPGVPAGQGEGVRPGSLQQRHSLVRKVWGNLPEREREQIMQFQPAEIFLPKYESRIEDYFKQLSETRETESP